MNKYALVLIILAWLINMGPRGQVYANIIEIPGDEDTVQGGITIALEGDTILVHEGTYYELIDFIGKNITVASEYLLTKDTTAILQTILDGDSSMTNGGGSVVSFKSGEDSTAVLCGFTIRNGIGSYVENEYSYGYVGGGIYGYYSSQKVVSNIIKHNTADARPIGGRIGQGGGIYLEGGSPQIMNNLIMSNEAYATGYWASIGDGGGLYIKDCIQTAVKGNNISYNESGWTGSGLQLTDSQVSISYNNICYNKYNTALNYWGDQYSYMTSIISNRIIGNYSFGIGIDEGGAEIRNNIIAFNERGYGISGGVSYLIIQNNTIASNGFYEDENYGGIYLSGDIADITNNIIVSNSGYGIKAYYPSPSTYINYNDVWDNTNGQYYNYEAGPRDISCNPDFIDLNEFHLSASSPCIDAGDPGTDIPDGAGDRIDIGAYEFPQLYNGALSYLSHSDEIEPGEPYALDFHLANPFEVPIIVDAWLEFSGPMCGVARKFLDVTISPGETTGTLNVVIPGWFTPGYYTVKGRLGIFGEEIWDSEVFDLLVKPAPKKYKTVW
jgi:hypothetical protein